MKLVSQQLLGQLLEIETEPKNVRLFFAQYNMFHTQSQSTGVVLLLT